PTVSAAQQPQPTRVPQAAAAVASKMARPAGQQLAAARRKEEAIRFGFEGPVLDNIVQNPDAEFRALVQQANAMWERCYKQGAIEMNQYESYKECIAVWLGITPGASQVPITVGQASKIVA